MGAIPGTPLAMRDKHQCCKFSDKPFYCYFIRNTSSIWHSEVLNQKVIYSTSSWELTIYRALRLTGETVVNKRNIPAHTELTCSWGERRHISINQDKQKPIKTSEKNKIEQVVASNCVASLDWQSGDTSTEILRYGLLIWMTERRQPHNDQSGRRVFRIKRRASAESVPGTSFIFTKEINQNYQLVLKNRRKGFKRAESF